MTTATAPNSLPATRVPFPNVYGAAAELFEATDLEVCLDGPAGTGKSYAALWKMHSRRLLFPDTRGLLARKTFISLKSSTLATYREQVAKPWLDAGQIRLWSARGDEPAHYAYPNGSKLVIAGLDRPGKAMSTEYDDILIDEALDCEEADVEALVSRIQRPGHIYGVEGRPPYAQLMLVTNPGPPHHWLNQRMLAGRTRRLTSRHEDNPAMTEEYLALLDRSLTGVRRDRLLLGLWVASEGMIYADSWSEPRNLVNHFRPPEEWPRYLSVDFGFTHPFVCQWWAQDPDGRLYLYRELYQTQRLVEDHARSVRAASGWGGEDMTRPTLPTYPETGRVRHDADPLPRAIFADHDAEGRATFERHLGLYTTAAHKAVKEGIDAVAARMRPAGDGRPRLFIMRDSLLERDQWLVARKLPTCTVEEIPGYVWDLAHAAAAAKEQPVKENDHGVDALRYLVASLDCRQSTVQWGPKIW